MRYYNLKLAIASDHGGFELKNKIYNYLIEKGYDIKDFGANSKESCDYPIFAKKVANSIINKECDCGILICGTGQGMAICANKIKGIRAVCVSDTYSAKMTKEHNNSNILTLGARVVGEGLAFDIVDIWLKSEFQKGRHQKRIDMLEQ